MPVTVEQDAWKAGVKKIKATDKTALNAMRKGIRAAAKPIGEATIAAGAALLPRSGGLADAVASGKVKATANQSRVKVILTQHRYGELDKGIIRHPVFGRRGKGYAWIAQKGPAGTFSTAAAEHTEELRTIIWTNLADALAGVSKGT